MSVPGAADGRYLSVGGYGVEIDAYRGGGLEYAVAVSSGTGNARSALLRLMELVLTRTSGG